MSDSGTSMLYTIEEHKHRFAAWAASRAASVNGCRFKVNQGKLIIEGASLDVVASSIDNLPQPTALDTQHRKWRNDIIQAAQRHQLAFTHGVAAKLINVYLKAIFVCGGDHADPRVKAIHPPVDFVLLEALYKHDIGGQRFEWQAAKRIRWSNLNCEQYERVISAIRQTISEGSGLWEIEEHWKGFQGAAGQRGQASGGDSARASCVGKP